MTTVPAASVLRENEIRPDHLMAEQAKRFMNDVRRLVARRQAFVHRPCPACQGDCPRPAFQKYHLDYVTCNDCATIYLDPRPTPELLAEYYAASENYAYWNACIFPASEPARREKIFRPRAQRLVEMVDRHHVHRGTLLEVGGGFGTFAEELHRLDVFARILVVEPTPELAGTCRARGLSVLEQPIETVALPPGSIEVIASFEVIEHLFAPQTFVARAAELLAPGGLLVLTCPNGQGFDVALLGPRSDTVDIEHLNYFNPRSLGRLVAGAGLEVLETSTPGKLDAELVRKKALAGELHLDDQPFLRTVLLERWDELGDDFQRFLAEHQLSSHLWLAARKPSRP